MKCAMRAYVEYKAKIFGFNDNKFNAPGVEKGQRPHLL